MYDPIYLEFHWSAELWFFLSHRSFES